MELGRMKAQRLRAVLLRAVLSGMMCFVSATVLANEYSGALSCGPERDYSYLDDSSASCFITPPQALEQLSRYQVIDVRPQKARFPSSQYTLAMSYSELLHKPFLKNKDLLLIDEGFGSIRQSNWCVRLKREGFQSVRYLQGGVKAYLGISKVSGIHTKFLSVVSPQNFWLEFKNSTVRVVSVGSGVKDKLEPLGVSVDVNFHKNELQGLVELMEFVETNQAYPPVPVVLISLDADEARALAESLNMDGLFFLEAGANGLSSFVKKHAAVLRQRSNSSSKGQVCNA